MGHCIKTSSGGAGPREKVENLSDNKKLTVRLGNLYAPTQGARRDRHVPSTTVRDIDLALFIFSSNQDFSNLVLDRGRARLRSKTNQPTHQKNENYEILKDEITVSQQSYSS